MRCQLWGRSALSLAMSLLAVMGLGCTRYRRQVFARVHRPRHV
jgi:hypothetical protein